MRWTKRRALVAVFAAAFAVVVGLSAVGFVMLSWSAINEANASRLAKGMTFEQACDMLGGPPRDETTGPVIPRPAVPGSGTRDDLL
jgi:hypothetical protein